MVMFGFHIREGLKEEFENYSVPACMSLGSLKKAVKEGCGRDYRRHDFYVAKSGDEGLGKKVGNGYVFAPGDWITVMKRRRGKGKK